MSIEHQRNAAPNELFYILCLERTKGGRNPVPVWWRPGSNGYTTLLVDAGQYSREEAYRICAESNYEDLPVPVYAMSELPYA